MAASSIIVEATYENGVFRPDHAVPLREHERVRIEVQPVDVAAATFGIVRWTGDSATLQDVALSPENAPEETP